MQSLTGNTSHEVKKEPNGCTGSSCASNQYSAVQQPIEVDSSSEEDDSQATGDTDEQSLENASKQLVLYDPAAHSTNEPDPGPQPIRVRRPGFLMPSRVLPSVGTFTVQCASCFKWRLIPSKEKYEEIREHILNKPFFCETAREWRPDISCDNPPDIFQDGSRLWAIDKPNIAQPPRGWQRLLRIRGEGSTKFADVYYESPTGKKLRSMVEVQKYLTEHPEYLQDGVSLSRFSFQIPKPLQQNYVRKRPARVTASCDDNRLLEASEVRPLAYVSPNDSTDLRLGRPAPPPALLPPPSFHAPLSDLDRPAKKQARGTPF